MAATTSRPTMRDHLRKALSSDAKARIASLLCQPAIGRLIAAASGDRIRSGPLVIETDAPTISPRTKAQIFWGIYESAEIRMLRRHLRPELDLLEIGSSIGVVSSHAAACLAPGSRIVCVEANPDLIPVIRRNLERNHPGREVAVHNCAIDYERAPGTTRMQLTEDTAGSRLGRFDVRDARRAREVDVPATTVSAVVAEHGLREYALVSDIEGAETGFIYADPRELEGCRQMVIELHDTTYQGRALGWADLLEALRERLGFRVVEGYGPVQVLER